MGLFGAAEAQPLVVTRVKCIGLLFYSQLCTIPNNEWDKEICQQFPQRFQQFSHFDKRKKKGREELGNGKLSGTDRLFEKGLEFGGRIWPKESVRQGRLKFPTERPVGHYHCISRIVDRRFIFEEAEKEHFTRLMREYEAFCQVRVLTFCVMSNHYHILLEVPKRPDVLLTAEQLLEWLKGLECEEDYIRTKTQIELFRAAKDGDGEKALLERYFRQMWDVSWFNRLLKQRFSAWFNHRTDRKGTLWEERFKSVLVDGCGEALLTMAAYIDLNPVRAGLTQDPKDYRWCGYGEAVAGIRIAKEGFKSLMNARDGVDDSILKRTKSSKSPAKTHIPTS